MRKEKSKKEKQMTLDEKGQKQQKRSMGYKNSHETVVER